MHAYNRMEAVQTDTIAVCATVQEWRDVLVDLVECESWIGEQPLEPGSIQLRNVLHAMGVSL